jgi:hypothetical protein
VREVEQIFFVSVDCDLTISPFDFGDSPESQREEKRTDQTRPFGRLRPTSRSSHLPPPPPESVFIRSFPSACASHSRFLSISPLSQALFLSFFFLHTLSHPLSLCLSSRGSLKMYFVKLLIKMIGNIFFEENYSLMQKY